MIVSDAGPIIIFARIRRLSLLHKVTESLTIPDAVHKEIVVNKRGMPGAAEDNAVNGADVAVIASPGQRDVAVGRHAIIGGVEIDPAYARAPRGTPGM